MVISWRLVAVCLICSGCGLERDYAAYLALPATEPSSSSSSSDGSQTASDGTDTGDAAGTESTSTGSSMSGSAGSSGATDDPTDTGSSTSGDPPAVCGDGEIAGDEECDDGNDVDIDECDNSCARAWTIFVTGESIYNGNINGLVGADTRCRNRAGNAGLPRWMNYVALISDSTTDAADRLHHAKGYYRLVNGLPVAHGWDALMYETLENPVAVTEVSETSPSVCVWTGTLPGGTAIPGAEHCKDWKSSSALAQGHYGSNNQVDAGWINDPEPKVNPTGCVASCSLYCIEQP